MMNATRTYQSLSGDEVKTVVQRMLDEIAVKLAATPDLAPHLSWPALCAEVRVTISSPDVLKNVELVAQLGPVHTPDDVRISHGLAVPEVTAGSAGIVERRRGKTVSKSDSTPSTPAEA